MGGVETKDPPGMPLMGVRVEYTSKRHAKSSLIHLNVAAFQSREGQGGTHGHPQPDHPGTPGRPGKGVQPGSGEATAWG